MRRFGEYVRAMIPRDSVSNVPVEYCALFAVVAILLCLRGFAAFSDPAASSAVAGTIQASTLRPISDVATRTDTHDLGDAGGPDSSGVTVDDTGRARAAAILPDLLPTALNFMGNVVYLHVPTERLFLDVGNLSSGMALKLELTAMPAVAYDAGVPAGGKVHLANNSDDRPIPALEGAASLHVLECAECTHKDASEVVSNESRQGYKHRARSQTVKIVPEELYSPSQVAAVLNLSYDAALRQMAKMKGVVDLGTPTRRYKRGKRKLRISGRNLLAFLSSKTIVQA